jgi:hypothetical protein
MERPYADQIRASIAQFDPGARRTAVPPNAPNQQAGEPS